MFSFFQFHTHTLAKPRKPMTKYITILLFLILPFLLSQNLKPVRHAEAAGPRKRRIQVTNDLDDIVDSEEDDGWKEWGKKSTSSGDESDLRPSDLWKMSDADIQAEMMNPHSGSSIGLVKLRFRSPPTEVMQSGFGFCLLFLSWITVVKVTEYNIMYVCFGQLSLII